MTKLVPGCEESLRADGLQVDQLDDAKCAVAAAERAALERLMECHGAGMICEFKVLDCLCVEVRSARKALEAAKP